MAQNTYYIGDRGKTPAAIYPLSVTPNDTVLRIDPAVSGATTHYIKLSGPDSKVIHPVKDVGNVEDIGGTKKYWINNAREAWKNQGVGNWKYKISAPFIKATDRMPKNTVYEEDASEMYSNGGNISNNSLNVMAKLQFNKVDPNFSNMTPNFLEGGEIGSNLGQLAKAAFQMANELKKQGAITEVAGEQVIAQAFQQTPEAAKMFVEAAQKQDVQTIVQLFTKLGIVK